VPDKTYKIVDVVGVSEESVHQAVRNALKKPSQTLRNLEWFEVQNIRGAVNSKGEPVFQVTLIGLLLGDLGQRPMHRAPSQRRLARPARFSGQKQGLD
jgi:dodecin